MEKFSQADAEAILGPCSLSAYIEIRADGVWPKVTYDKLLRAETKQLRWRPARELQGQPNAPVVLETPALPFPFDARQLAAFMLDGVGALVADFYGDWDEGPDTDSLAEIGDPDSRGCIALMQAFDAVRAERVEGRYTDRKGKEHPCIDVRTTVRKLLEDVEEGHEERKPSLQARDAEPTAGANKPAPIKTGDVAHAFAGLRGWGEKAWKDTLGSPPKWLKACLVLPGQRGVREHHWDPVLIGDALIRRGDARPNSIRARFQTKLQPWLEAWKTHEADNFDTP